MNEKESKVKKNKKNIILIIIGILILLIVLFLLWFFNRKFEVTFDYNNGSKEKAVYVKYNRTINTKDIDTKEKLGDKFLGWYLVVDLKSDKLSKEPFNFKTKINKNTKLKAVYDGKVDTITITFDSKGGSKVDCIVLNKGAELILPENPKKDGYTFKYWVDKHNNKVENKTKFEKDRTLTAIWEEIKKEPKKNLRRKNQN